MYYDFYIPGVMAMYSESYPSGTTERCNGEPPIGIEPITRDVTNQSITPMSEQRSRFVGPTTERRKPGAG